MLKRETKLRPVLDGNQPSGVGGTPGVIALTAVEQNTAYADKSREYCQTKTKNPAIQILD
jgi:hypothetical protein